MPLSNPRLAKHLIPDLPNADELLVWLRRIDANRWYTNFGPLVQEFERVLRRLAGPEDAAMTTLATGHHALELGLRALGLPGGGRVLMPAVTFPSCPLAAIHAGLTPVFADIDADNWSLTPEIARRIAAKHEIAAIMPVAVYGVPAPAQAWDAFARDTGIAVLIDAAAAFGVQEIPRHCLTAFSFHATKPFGIGEGGALFGYDEAVIARARELSSFGRREHIAYSHGTNAKISEYHAAVGLAQTARWDGIKARRAALLESYRARLEGLPLRLQSGIARAVVSILMLAGEGVDAPRWIEALQTRGIAAHHTYLPPLYRHPAFMIYAAASGDGVLSRPGAEAAAKAALCPQAEYMVAHAFGVPFHSFMDENDVDEVCGALKALL